MLEELSKLKTPADWGKHQFNAILSSDFGWSNLGEQHFLASKVLLMDCWNALNEYNTLYKNTTEFGYGTKEFEILQKTYFYEPATLLLALSFENFLKGIWVKQNQKSLFEKNFLPVSLKTHDLNKLAKLSGMVLTEDEKEMLNLLTLFSIWRGKYNIPTDQEKNIEYFAGRFHTTFLLKKYPGEFDLPDEVKSMRMKISDKLNISLL